MPKPVWADRYAVVTGASSGIGAEFARQLAARGSHLVLTARREDRLEAIAAELATDHGTKSVLLPGDLSNPAEPQRLFEAIAERELDVSLLVNNAGFGQVATVPESDLTRTMGIVQVNMAALTELMYRFLDPMLARDEGSIINVASVAAFQPIPYMPVYAASKAYVLHLTEGLWAELRQTGVHVMAVCPGTTRTEFFDHAGSPGWAEKHMSSTVEQVVRAALKGCEKQRPVVVPGLANKFLTKLPRIGARKDVALIARRFFKPRNVKELTAESTAGDSED